MGGSGVAAGLEAEDLGRDPAQNSAGPADSLPPQQSTNKRKERGEMPIRLSTRGYPPLQFGVPIVEGKELVNPKTSGLGSEVWGVVAFPSSR